MAVVVCPQEWAVGLMFKAIAFGLGVGAGIQAWRNFPPDGPVTASSLALVFAVGILCAFFGGLWSSRGRGGAHAMASASAEAVASAVNSNTVQLAVVMPGAGARASGVSLPSDQAPWMVGASERPQITLDDLDGLDPAELFETDSTPEAAT